MRDKSSNQSGFTLIEILVLLVVLIITTAGGVMVWQKKVSPMPTPTPTIIIPTPRAKTSQIPTEQTKMLWEDSVCGNGICEPCENECCNYPCVGEACPPPTCLGYCPQDCSAESTPPPAGSEEYCHQFRHDNCPKECQVGPSCPICQDVGCHAKGAHQVQVTPIFCRTDVDCPPVIGVCMPGKCPTYRCLNGHCVYFEDAMVLESCLGEATLQECSERYGR